MATDIVQLIKECVLKVLYEEISADEHRRIRDELYTQLEGIGFQRLGNQPRQYMEYYLNGFATIQCAIMLDQNFAYVERYYDNERLANEHNLTKSIPLPEHYDNEFVVKLFKYCAMLKRSIDGDESIYGGMDDLEETLSETATTPDKLSNSERSKIHNAFKKVGVDGNGRFEKKEHGLAAITSALSSLGFQLDMVSADIIMGDKGSRNLTFRRENTPGQDAFTEQPEIMNSRIVFNWERLDGPTHQHPNSPSVFEILSYAS